MKPRTITAIAIAVAITLTLTSCRWFTTEKKTTSSYEKIAGTWHGSIDTTGNSFFWSVANKDSFHFSVEFSKDSTYHLKQVLRMTDSGRIVIDTTKATMYVRHFDNTAEDSFRIEQFSDSLLLLRTLDKDSTRIKLTR